MLAINIKREQWPLRQRFMISRGAKTEAEVVVVELQVEGYSGQAECVPYQRYGESAESVVEQIQTLNLAEDPTTARMQLARELGPGAARNALDCALWDLQAKQEGRPVWDLAELAPLEPVNTAYTISMDEPAAMAEAAAHQADRPLLKLKLGSEQIVESVAAVRESAPSARLIVDANEAWSLDQLKGSSAELARLGVELIEQPLPAEADAGLDSFEHLIPIAADEACHTCEDLRSLARRYDVVNIKLDKTGGLTEALSLRKAAEREGFGVMVGCMVGTSLAMAPAVLVAQGAQFVDLDGPLLLAEDRPHSLQFAHSEIQPPSQALWG